MNRIYAVFAVMGSVWAGCESVEMTGNPLMVDDYDQIVEVTEKALSCYEAIECADSRNRLLGIDIPDYFGFRRAIDVAEVQREDGGLANVPVGRSREFKWMEFCRGYVDAMVLFDVTGRFPFAYGYYCDFGCYDMDEVRRAYVYGWWSGAFDFFREMKHEDLAVALLCRRRIEGFKLLEQRLSAGSVDNGACMVTDD